MLLLSVAERLASPERYWSVVVFFRLGVTLLYYIYLRALFINVPNWSQFVLYQGVHLCTEFGPLALYSDRYIHAINFFTANILRAPRLGVVDTYRYRLRTVRMVALKEWIRCYSILAVGVLIGIVHSYRNSVYYEKFSRQSLDYTLFAQYMAASLAAELFTAWLLTLMFQKIYHVRVWRSAALLLDGQEWFLFILCVLMTTHVTNDPFTSLLKLKL